MKKLFLIPTLFLTACAGTVPFKQEAAVGKNNILLVFEGCEEPAVLYAGAATGIGVAFGAIGGAIAGAVDGGIASSMTKELKQKFEGYDFCGKFEESLLSSLRESTPWTITDAKTVVPADDQERLEKYVDYLRSGRVLEKANKFADRADEIRYKKERKEMIRSIENLSAVGNADLIFALKMIHYGYSNTTGRGNFRIAMDARLLDSATPGKPLWKRIIDTHKVRTRDGERIDFDFEMAKLPAEVQEDFWSHAETALNQVQEDLGQ